MIRTEIAQYAAQSAHSASAQATAAAREHYTSALPGEWLMLCLLIVMAAALGAAVLARGAVEHRRLRAQRVERWHEWRESREFQESRRRRAEQDERAEGRDCG